jgi:TrmH family RNA methyltransferase
LLTSDQRDRIDVVLVSPRNPLNIGAVARAMANFGFSRLTVVAPYEPHWREARSAVGAPQLLADAREVASIADAVRDCTLVLGTGTLTHRKPEQPVVPLDKLTPRVVEDLSQGRRIAVVFGPEKHGLTREDLSWCHLLVEIPTDSRQPSMNLGQAAAVLLYELATRVGSDSAASKSGRDSGGGFQPTTSGDLDILGTLIEEVMAEAKYSPKSMEGANRHDLRVMLRRLNLTAADGRRALGLFRRILWRLKRYQP